MVESCTIGKMLAKEIASQNQKTAEKIWNQKIWKSNDKLTTVDFVEIFYNFSKIFFSITLPNAIFFFPKFFKFLISKGLVKDANAQPLRIKRTGEAKKGFDEQKRVWNNFIRNIIYKHYYLITLQPLIFRIKSVNGRVIILHNNEGIWRRNLAVYFPYHLKTTFLSR